MADINITTTPSNLTSTPTASIQKSLGVTSDGIYGTQTAAAVKAFQQSVGLTADGIFGPQTLAAYNSKYGAPSSTLISTSAPAQTAFNSNSRALNDMLAKYNASGYGPNGGTYGSPVVDASGKTVGTAQFDPSTGKPLPQPTNTNPSPVAPTSDPTLGTEQDPFIQQLDNLKTTADAGTGVLISNIQSQEQQQATKLQQQSDSYQKGLQLLGIQSGAAAATPDLLMGHIQQAKNDLQDKLNTLTANETKAITDATNAQNTQDFNTLKEKMDYIKQVQTDKQTALKDYYTELTTYDKNATTTANGIASDVYDSLQTLDSSDQQSFINAIALKFGIPAGTLVTALGTVASKDTLTPAQAKTLGVPYGTTKTQAAQMNITPTSGSGSTKPMKSGTATFSSSDLSSYQSLIQNGGTEKTTGQKFTGIGADGYADPGAVVAALNDWVAKGGSEQDFATKFKVSKIVNPASYSLLPAAIRPTLTKTKAAQAAAATGSSGRHP